MQIKYQLSATVILAQPADYEICQSRQRVNLYGIAGPAEVRTSAGPVASHGEAAWIIQNRLKFCVTHATFSVLYALNGISLKIPKAKS